MSTAKANLPGNLEVGVRILVSAIIASGTVAVIWDDLRETVLIGCAWTLWFFFSLNFFARRRWGSNIFETAFEASWLNEVVSCRRAFVSSFVLAALAYYVGYYGYGLLTEAAAKLLPHWVILAVVPGTDIMPLLGPNGLDYTNGHLTIQRDIDDIMLRYFREVLLVLWLGFYLAHLTIAKPPAKAAIANS